MIPISVVIPCFPRDTHKLKTCLDSIENQTILPLEVIIGHSEITEEDCNILKNTLCYSFDVKISPTLKKCFAAENRNRACEIVKGEYISFIDADDQMFPQRLEILWQIIKQYNPKCVIHGYSNNKHLFSTTFPYPHSNLLTFGDELYKLAKDTEHKHIHLNGKIHHAHSTVRTDITNSIKYNESSKYHRLEDSKFIRDILYQNEVNDTTMIFVDLPLSYYIPGGPSF